jgi:hypothetical protein
MCVVCDLKKALAVRGDRQDTRHELMGVRTDGKAFVIGFAGQKAYAHLRVLEAVDEAPVRERPIRTPLEQIELARHGCNPSRRFEPIILSCAAALRPP